MKTVMKTIVAMLLLTCTTPAWATAIPDADSAAAQTYTARCSVCHSLPHPARLDWAHWRHMLHVMKQRMAERQITLPDEDWRQIAGYLQSHAR